MATLMMLSRFTRSILRTTNKNGLKAKIMKYSDGSKENLPKSNQVIDDKVSENKKFPHDFSGISSGSLSAYNEDEVTPETEELDRLLFELNTQMDFKNKHEEKIETASFATLLRNSVFVQYGDFKNQVVPGKVQKVVRENLYIDIGAKFYVVCNLKADMPHREYYRPGSWVIVQLFDLEMTGTFFDAARAVTLAEVDGVLLGLTYFERSKNKLQKSNRK